MSVYTIHSKIIINVMLSAVYSRTGSACLQLQRAKDHVTCRKSARKFVRVDQCVSALRAVEIPRAVFSGAERNASVSNGCISTSVRCYFPSAAVKVISLLTLPAAGIIFKTRYSDMIANLELILLFLFD